MYRKNALAVISRLTLLALLHHIGVFWIKSKQQFLRKKKIKKKKKKKKLFTVPCCTLR
jgi:hypothetical protein